MFAAAAKKWPETAEIDVDGSAVSVTVRVSERARSYRLSLPHTGVPLLTVPRHGRWPEARAFLERQRGWLAVRLERSVKPVAFAAGATIPLRGIPHLIVATGKVRGTVAVIETPDGRQLLVPGAPEHRARRLTDWLKAEAQRDLELASVRYAGILRVTIRSVATRNQTSRWGSCSSSGNLNYNWKLVLAPPHVLDYVAAHECAHILEMNHSDRFWLQVERALPDMKRGKAWLRAHGRELMAYGA